MLRSLLIIIFSFQQQGDLSIDSEDVVFNMITTLTDENWKRVRNLLTPTFTSGKLKGVSSNSVVVFGSGIAHTS